MALGRQQLAVRGQNSVTFRPASKRLGPVSNTIVLIVLACLLGLLAAASARLQSLDTVKDSSEAKSLVAVAPSGTVE